MPDEKTKSAEASGDAWEIVVPVSSWFYRRCLLLAGLLAGMTLYFCYDGFVGYPKQNLFADAYDAFLAGKNGEANPRADGDSAVLLSDAYQAGADGRRWATHAATLHLPAEPPKRHTAVDMATQKRIALALGLAVLLIAIWAMLHRGRAWRMRAGRVRSPWGTEISMASITDIDRRRWNRGIALLISHDGGRFLKLKIDDYKYSGMGKIIESIATAHPEVRIDPPLTGTVDSTKPETDADGTG